jgi:hypothetical protein
MPDLLDIIEKKQEPEDKKPAAVYPLVEEMTFRAIISNEAEGYALLRAVQILVNELGATQIVALMNKIEKKPSIMQQAKTYLPYILSL